MEKINPYDDYADEYTEVAAHRTDVVISRAAKSNR